MQNPLSGCRTTTPANEQAASQGQSLANPLTPSSQPATTSNVSTDMDMKPKPEPKDTRGKHERIESSMEVEAGAASQIEHQGEASLGQDAGMATKIDEAAQNGEENKQRMSVGPSVEQRTTTESPSLPLASDTPSETTKNSKKEHEAEKRAAAESLLILNQGKAPKRKRSGPGIKGSRTSSKNRNKDSDELEYLGTRPVLRPLHPRRVTPQQDALSQHKRRSAEQRARTFDLLNHATPNGSNFNMPPMPYPIGTVPLASPNFVLSTRPGLQPGMHAAAPSAPYYTRPADYVYPSAAHSHPGSSSYPSSYPPIEIHNGIQRQQQLAQMPVSDRDIEAIGRWRDFSHLNEAPATTAGQNNLFPPPYPEPAPIGPFGYPQNPESLVLMNLATRNAHLQPPSHARYPPVSRNVILPPPTCTASTRYASLPTNFGALHLARGLYNSNTYYSTEYQKYQQALADAHAAGNLQRDLDFNHWRNRHSQKWVRKEGVHDGSGDYAAERLPKLVEPKTTPTRKLPAMEAQGVNMGYRGAEGALKAGGGEVSREEVAGRGKRPWEL
ncbi:hypothetical protein CB0940_11252 [Cercospora beticola]|uniref:Uncharacterized protein n=1 Tax=Cercospora beticola TaxID=122368 RepID=A0A2G5HCX6_CERBT|nr:hypothetical protein CB0940_11252 [Cercospora beticola]PIA90416.1 hypothetical protein CB0940_11252 [Cercospora beticola]WPB08084.1 hypothetical protein RHO25_012748 [Cercospora beticola]CAK1368052.1 unnamed protein product [Cercospora beticola]